MTEAPDPSADPGERIAIRRLDRSIAATAAEVRRAVRHALNGTPLRGLSIAIVDDASIARLHANYMNDATPTDVLTFDLRDDAADDAIEGEIVVSAETARRQADRRSLAPREELLRYVIHGVLHLLGFDDATPAQRRSMRQREDRVLLDITPVPRTSTQSSRRASSHRRAARSTTRGARHE